MTLHTKYRPDNFDDVIGQNEVVDSIRNILDAGSSRALLLTGPAGTGKTTLARIVASQIGCDEMGVTEIDGATHTGIDAMRKISETAHYKSLGGSGVRCFIVDECHQLSKATWNSLLKIVEEPPAHVYWVFCTTEVTKVPKTIRSRCAEFTLRDVYWKQLEKLVRNVMDKEGMALDSEIVELIARSAFGSPRQALVNLAKCVDATSLENAEYLLKLSTGSKTTHDLSRCIFGNDFTLANVQAILLDLKDTSPESVRIPVFAYATTVLLKARDERSAKWASRVLGAFETQCLEQNKIGDIAVRCARLIFLKRDAERS